MENLLTTREAAERLGVSAGRVRQMVADGELPVQRIGRDNFVKEADLTLVEGRKRGRPPRPKDEKTSKVSKKVRNK